MYHKRRHSIPIVCAVLWLVVSSRDLVLGQVLSGPPQAWIAPIPVERAAAEAPAEPGESVRWLLKDRQIDEEVDQNYAHEALQILTPSGVQDASQISIDFDPTCETLTFHWVRILRGGATLDRFDPGKVHVIQREAELENHLFSGVQTALLLVDDVRQGDILDYAYTVTGVNPSLGGRWFGGVPAQLETPVGRLRTRLLWPAQRKLYTKNYLTDARPIIAPKGDLIEFVWDFKNTPGLHVEEQLPIWYDPFPIVQLSEFHQWSEVNQWALELFTNATSLSPELVSQIKEWRGLKDHNAETLAVLQFLQDEIRYLGIESGPNAYTPASPSTVFGRRYGDCKDKTLLLVTVLRALGIPAFPVLVNTTARQTIAERQPSSTLFDHAIVQANVDGQVYYLDPTATFQRGPLFGRYHPDYGFGLVVRPGSLALTPIPPSGGQPLTTVNEYFRLGRPPNGSALKVVTIADGEDAVAMRERYATTARDQIERQDLNFFAKQYPQISQTDPSVFLDDEANNRIEVDEFYRIDGDWTPPPPNVGGWWTFRIYSHNVDAAVRRPGASYRTMPLGISYPRHEIFHMETVPPVMNYNGDEDRTVRNAAFYYHRSVSAVGHTLALNFEYNALSDFVPIGGIPEFTRHLEQASDLLDYTIESYAEQQ